MGTELRLPMPAEHFVPHRGRMLLVGDLVECGNDRAEARACFSEDSPFVDSSGLVHELALVELIAQTYAAMRGYEVLRARQPMLTGYLVGVSETSVIGCLRAGEICGVRVHTKGVFAMFAVADGEVRRGDDVLVRGVIKTYEVPRRDG